MNNSMEQSDNMVIDEYHQHQPQQQHNSNMFNTATGNITNNNNNNNNNNNDVNNLDEMDAAVNNHYFVKIILHDVSVLILNIIDNVMFHFFVFRS